MDLDLGEIEQLAKSAGNGVVAEYVARDIRRIEPMLKSSDAATVQAAVRELQGWADGAPGLRKAFAGQFLERIRGALGHMKPHEAVSHYGKVVKPGEAMQGGVSEGLKARMAPKPHAQPAVGGAVQQGDAHGRLDPANKPAPRIQHGLLAHPRLSAPAQVAGAPPKPDGAVADKAHHVGAKLAAMSAHHGFKLGLAAAATAGAVGAHGLSEKQREERSHAAKARWQAHGKQTVAA